MEIDKISKQLLDRISNLHKLPNGAVSFRKNGQSEFVNSTKNIEIRPKLDRSGIDVFIKSDCKGESCHIPVVISEANIFDLVYNDFYIEEGAEVTIVAGCGIHSDGDAGHDGIHNFHVGKNAKVTYVENHLAIGKGKKKTLNPQTVINLDCGAVMNMETVQIGGVDFSNRITKVKLKDNSTFNADEKILTSRFEVAKTDFTINLLGDNSKAMIVSRSVARDESEQVFKSNMIGKSECFGRVECDGIVLNNSRITSVPKVDVKCSSASLSHEATIGKIAGDQIIKLMTLGLTENEAETKIIEGYLNIKKK